jgi:hypothetical protein
MGRGSEKPWLRPLYLSRESRYGEMDFRPLWLETVEIQPGMLGAFGVTNPPSHRLHLWKGNPPTGKYVGTCRGRNHVDLLSKLKEPTFYSASIPIMGRRIFLVPDGGIFTRVSVKRLLSHELPRATDSTVDARTGRLGWVSLGEEYLWACNRSSRL